MWISLVRNQTVLFNTSPLHTVSHWPPWHCQAHREHLRVALQPTAQEHFHLELGFKPQTFGSLRGSLNQLSRSQQYMNKMNYVQPGNTTKLLQTGKMRIHRAFRNLKFKIWILFNSPPSIIKIAWNHVTQRQKAGHPKTNQWASWTFIPVEALKRQQQRYTTLCSYSTFFSVV